MKRIFKAISVLFLICLFLVPLSACRSKDKGKRTDVNTERTTDCPDDGDCPDDPDEPEHPQPRVIPKRDPLMPAPPKRPPHPPIHPLPYPPHEDEEDEPIFKVKLPFDRGIDEYRP